MMDRTPPDPFNFPTWFRAMGFRPGGRGNGGDYRRVAELLGVSRNYVGALYRGERRPSVVLARLAEKLLAEKGGLECSNS